jgi:hypothetical protein
MKLVIFTVQITNISQSRANMYYIALGSDYCFAPKLRSGVAAGSINQSRVKNVLKTKNYIFIIKIVGFQSRSRSLGNVRT